MKVSYQSTYKGFTRFVIETFSISLFTFVLLVQSYNIFSRYAKIGYPIMWAEEFTRYSIIWIVFLCWHLDQRDENHFNVNIISGKLKGKPKFFLEIFISIGIILFAIFLCYSSWLYYPSTMIYCAKSFQKIPMGIFYLAIPIGIIFLLIEEIIILHNKIKIWSKEGK